MDFILLLTSFYLPLASIWSLWIVIPVMLVIARGVLLKDESTWARIVFWGVMAGLLGPVAWVGHGIAIVPVFVALLLSFMDPMAGVHAILVWMICFGAFLLLDWPLHAWTMRRRRRQEMDGIVRPPPQR